MSAPQAAAGERCYFRNEWGASRVDETGAELEQIVVFFLWQPSTVDRLSTNSRERGKELNPDLFWKKKLKIQISGKKKALISVSDKTGIVDFAKVKRERKRER